MANEPFPLFLQSLLHQRKDKQLFRSLKTKYPSVDFSSNDYLGFSSQGILHDAIKKIEPSFKEGATGSRLISGNSVLYEELENTIAAFHGSSSALLYNSGYDSNLGVLSCIPQKGDLILSDELIHASLIDGIRLSHATNYKFKHNDVKSLTQLAERHRAQFKEVYLVVESVYSMDGDNAPLEKFVKVCRQYNIHLIVDEAHALGVFGEKGKGLCHLLNLEDACFARIYTFGKSMGCHGAVVLGSESLRSYLINFSRSFIYTTAMPQHSLLAIKAAYDLLQTTDQIQQLQNNIRYFNTQIEQLTQSADFIESKSSIHCKLVSGNERVQALEDYCWSNNVFVKSIKSPTVKESQERIRICLHAYNTRPQIDQLLELISWKN